ncbi:hypothetical protein CN692_18755 [Bacillus sp. AFS002410]|uniref:hypothetical protein n=1 Tax=Bacillus sp. AFS002410 TaxID=2033481 RepID=UPI000BF0F8F3|nr:hypothetical protein [Bacillus sp. AFS002410]PEJ56168.1 hypothetical protein CN692_18755 [Bacillus sp. AFS002410]
MKKKGWNELFKKDDLETNEQEFVRPGICTNCGHGSFKLKIVKHRLLRGCKKCGEVIDPENMKVLRKGIECSNENE